MGSPRDCYGTHYSLLRRQAPHINAALDKLITHPDIRMLIDARHPDALHLVFQPIKLGAPVDSDISDFSMQAYLRFGLLDGGRRTPGDLRKGLHSGHQVFRPELPTVLICVHEMSRTGTPVVVRDLVREASRTHNVVVATLRGGDLLDQFLPHCCGALVTDNPLREMPYMNANVVRRIDHAVLNSVEYAPFIHALVSQDIPFAAYSHEYADYTFPSWKSLHMAAFADLLIFSSEHVRDICALFPGSGCVDFRLCHGSDSVMRRDHDRAVLADSGAESDSAPFFPKAMTVRGLTI